MVLLLFRVDCTAWKGRDQRGGVVVSVVWLLVEVTRDNEEM